MKRKKVVRKVMKKFMLYILPSIIILVSVSEIISYTFRIIDLKNQQETLASEYNELRAKEHELKIEIQKLQDPEYIARYARENYLYSKDGEYIIKIDNNQDEDTNNSNTNGFRWYAYILPILIILTLLFISFRNYNIKNKNKKKKVLK